MSKLATTSSNLFLVYQLIKKTEGCMPAPGCCSELLDRRKIIKTE